MQQVWLLLATIAIETAIALVALPRARRRLRVDVPLANCLTHPIAYALIASIPGAFWPVEVLVVAAEALVYRRVTGLSWRQAIWLSVGCNATTIAISLLAF